MSFDTLGLEKPLLKALTAKGYVTPTPIQQQAIPEVIAGCDIMAGAQTGTGKTAAFALPILHKLLQANSTHTPQALVLVPTRELAQQVGKSFVDYAQHTNFRTAVIYGGVSLNGQLSELHKGTDIIVATPGRLIDHLKRGSIKLEQITTIVLDEADRMLDMGFIDDIKLILKQAPSIHQTLLFSATFNDLVFELGNSLLNNPTLIEVDDRNATAIEVEQIAYEVDADRKREITSYLVGYNNWQQVLIFTRTKNSADSLAKEMNKDGLKTSSIHGDKSQGARDKAMEEFKTGKIRALVATDVASRGLDIKQLKHVINYELPYNAEDYVHRIGRTGRAGESGQAITLLSAEESYLLEDIHKLIGTRLLQQWLPGFEPDLTKDFSNQTKKPNAKKRRRRR